MQIPNLSELAKYRQQGETERQTAREAKNEQVKRHAIFESNSRFTEDYVAEKIAEMMKTPGGNTVSFQTVRYDLETENGTKTEYVPFPKDIIEKIKAAGLLCSARYVNTFGIFFTTEAENKWYR